MVVCFGLLLPFVPCAWTLEDSRNPAEWYERAAEDFEIANLLFEKGEYFASVCFHAHQAIEKTFKGALFQQGVSPEWTHDTRDLALRFSKFYPPAKALAGACSEMDRLYVPSRYPKAGVQPIQEDDAAACLKSARAVLEMITASSAS